VSAERRPAKGAGHSLTAKIDSHECSAQVEAIVFLDGARRWIDHGLVGDIGLAEAATAAQMLCARAERLALAA
jgi:hypothetical protein